MTIFTLVDCNKNLPTQNRGPRAKRVGLYFVNWASVSAPTNLNNNLRGYHSGNFRRKLESPHPAHNLHSKKYKKILFRKRIVRNRSSILKIRSLPTQNRTGAHRVTADCSTIELQGGKKRE